MLEVWTGGIFHEGVLLGEKEEINPQFNKYVSKQELYFVNENYEMFSTEVSAREKQGQNNGGPHEGVIGSLVVSSVGRPF